MNLRGGRCRNTIKNKGAAGGKKVTPGEEELDRLIAATEYEVYQDPYRGLKSHQQSLETGTRITTPWNACMFGSFPPERTLKEDLCPQATVRHVGHCACPSLKAWTLALQSNKKDNSKKSGKKRSRNESISEDPLFSVGLRPSEPGYCSPCDYNPLCLGSLGGVMNEVLVERCKDMEIRPPPSPILKESKQEESPPKLAKSEGNRDIFEAKQSKSTSKDAKQIIDLENDDVKEIKLQSANADVFAFLGDSAENSEKGVIKSKPLVRNAKTIKGEAAVVFTEDPQNHDFGPTQYAPLTTKRLNGLRRCLETDESKIRSYVFHTLRIGHLTNGNAMTLDEYMNNLRRWHESLIFANPCDKEKQVPNGQIRVSVPPGIHNLGATCYLNTQLQCLAQNQAFLNGIFSWRMVNSTHNMNSVMSKLQQLLGQMVLGGDCKLSTLDFSNALGLVHDEQQDPNEFARLLFERMDESFQQCGEDLSNLLEKIFHGVATYETVCMTCNNASERSEGFMDLNLPIAKRPKVKATTIKEAFAKRIDTDVQYCLDQYTCVELLEGDNQYFCSACNAKRDAKRRLKFTEMPPVLNVQLSRYVFDRTQYVKKKLTDKVLLPTTLYAERSGGDKKKYLLCAVMRHQGNSAYSGHYVAEAMDWLTGQWFEFNDDTVKSLPQGPSCSFDPLIEQMNEGCSERNGDQKNGKSSENEKKAVSGSQDAYNMYYVDEDFLGKSAADTVLRRGQFCYSSKSDKLREAGYDVLCDVAKQREEMYGVISEMCFLDGRASDRIRRRKTGIRRFLFPNAGSLLPIEIESNLVAHNESHAWIRSDVLKRYLRCNRDLDEQLSSTDPILSHRQLLCEHGRLHPRVARKGKLLPRCTFDAFMSLLQGERNLLHQESQTVQKANEVCDLIVLHNANLFCPECSQSYSEKLSQKLDHLKNLKNLYEALDPALDDSPLLYKEDIPTCAEERFAYLISRQTATKYRKMFGTLMKKLSKFEDGGIFDADIASSVQSPILYEGLDALELPGVQVGFVSNSGDKAKVGAKKNDNSDKLDILFNSNITCPHGKCNVMNNGRVSRFISWKAWSMLKKVFPDAIEHKKRRRSMSEPIDEPDGDTNTNGCPECSAEKASMDNMRNQLGIWVKETRENFQLKNLLQRNRTVSREIEVHNFTNASSGCRLVHRTDIETVRIALKKLSASKMKLMDFTSLKAEVESVAFPSYHSVVLEFERQPMERLLSSLRSLICREHRRVIKSALFRDFAGTCKESNSSRQLSDCIAVLSDEEYRAYISCLAGLLCILNPEYHKTAPGSIGSPVVVDEKPFLQEVREMTSSYHPAIRQCVDKEQRPSDDILKFSLDGSTKDFILSPGVCNCKTCMQDFAPLLSGRDAGDDDKVESISIDSNDRKSDTAPKDPKPGSVAADPILVESDIEDFRIPTPDTFALRTFEIDKDATLDEALRTLKNVSDLPSESKSNDVSLLRRSSRKRKSRYPIGCLLRDGIIHVGLHHNMAALRLHLFETCEVPVSGHNLILVLLSNDGQSQEALKVQFEWGERQLDELVDKMRDKVEVKDDTFSPSESLVLLYQKENSSEGQALHETVMASLINLANIETSKSDHQVGNGKKTKRNRPSERGFRGTLLHSSSLSAENQGDHEEDKKMISDVSAMSADTSALGGVTAVSDEEKDNTHRIEEPVDKKGAILTESSDDDDAVLKSPLSIKKTISGRSNNDDIPIGSKIVIDSDSSDSEGPIIGKAHERVVKKPQDVTPERPSEVEERPHHGVEDVILASLKEAVDQPADDFQCKEAVKWAIASNPGEKRENLLDIALAKYLEFQY